MTRKMDGKSKFLKKSIFDVSISTASGDKNGSNKAIDYPIPINVSIWLVFSSFFFMVPGVYAFIHSFYFYGSVSAITTLCSANHWRNAEDGVRRTIDRIVAHASFITYLVTGCVFLRGVLLYGYGTSVGGIMLIFYYFSARLAKQGNSRWVYCHFLFHVFVALGQYLVMYATVRGYKSRI